jgi:hypothetical protein
MTLAWLTLVKTLAGMVPADVVNGRIGWTPTRTKGVLKFSNSTPTPYRHFSFEKKTKENDKNFKN